jgi:hypothetical protein
MKLTVLVEPISDGGFRARSGDPLPITAEGATEEAALRNLRQMIDARLVNGTKLVLLEVKPYEHPFAKYAGRHSPDDPVVQQWKQLVEEYRRERDADPDY